MTVVGQMALKAAADAAAKLAFYEWAYGRLAEPDSDIGILGEFMCGLHVGGLAARRREKQPYDLVASNGETVEVKTSFGRERSSHGTRDILRWNLRNERAALQGARPVADRWLFVHVGFPADTGRFFDVFDPSWWRVWAVPGGEVRRLNPGSNLSEACLARAGFRPHPLAELPRLVCPSSSPVAELARTHAEDANALLRLAFFRWAYGDLTEGFNGGRFAEFQVLRVLGRRPFPPRRTKGPVDLVTRHGHAVEVKFSQAYARTADGAWRCNYLIPMHHGERQVDHFVFCQLAEPGLDPVPLANWRFRWVPAEALADHRRKVSNLSLDRLGFAPLSAAGLRAAEGR